MQPTLYIPHGGGPCFFMEWTMGPPDLWNKMQKWLESLASTFEEKPTALLVISAHWEEAEFTTTAAAQPELIYDYYGFPEHTYELQYPAAGLPSLAEDVVQRLQLAGLEANTDLNRGFDHGSFIPLKLIYPDADIPLVQLSLQTGLDPSAHLAAGRALTELREQGVLIIGSGMSFHNMEAARFPDSAEASESFDGWLQATCSAPGSEREKRLIDWEQAPRGRFSHPREEHLLPLMVCAGAAGNEAGRCVYRDSLGGNIVSAFRFGG